MASFWSKPFDGSQGLHWILNDTKDVYKGTEEYSLGKKSIDKVWWYECWYD